MAKTATSGATPIEALLREKRKFPPPKDFVKHANVNTPSIYKDAAKNPARFWERFARELHWFKPWKKALEWKVPYSKWFVGGKLNVSYNCLDRHIETARRTKAALIWEGEPGDTRTLTYWDLYREVNRFAAALKRRGVKKGDRVTIYMPMVPETAIAMLACTRIGAPHSVIFGGFAPDAVKERIHDAESTVLITADGGWRRGSIVPLKKNVDEALGDSPEVKTVIVLKRTGQEIAMEPGRPGCHWLLIRRNRHTRELAFYHCYAPAGRRWPPWSRSLESAGARKRTSKPARGWPTWTSTRSAPGPPGTGGSPWRCSPWPSSPRRP